MRFFCVKEIQIFFLQAMNKSNIAKDNKKNQFLSIVKKNNFDEGMKYE